MGRRSTLEALAREQDDLAAWLCRKYVALSFEDAEDLVVEALSRVDGELPDRLSHARAYLRTMLERDAIDELRRRFGRRAEEKAQKPTLISLGEVTDADIPPDPHTSDGELARLESRRLAQEAVHLALARLPEQERETLRLRYLDGVGPEEVCRQLGLSHTQYERRIRDGIQHAFVALLVDTPHDSCRRVRRAIGTRPRLLAAEDAARRDAHFEECIACQAWERRARGLLELLPHGHVVGLVQRGAEVVAAGGGASAGATAAAGAGGAGAVGGAAAGGLLAGGAAVKIAAVCSSAAVAITCVTQLAPTPDHRADIKRPSASAERTAHRSARTTDVPPAATPTPAPIRPRSTAEPQHETGGEPRATRSRRSRPSSGRDAPAPPAPTDSAHAEFGPEGTGSSAPAPSAYAAGDGASATAPSTSSSSAPQPQPATQAPGGEFEP